MNTLIKKLKSCRYSTAAQPTRRDEPFHNTRHHCVHPVMKVDWKLERCGGCKYYELIPKPETLHSTKK
ncbi:MAG: hypothetical protein PHX83_05825 [Acidobacteriia bacterium]|nr:hypothetical protein [Terriglobia bacterium]